MISDTSTEKSSFQQSNENRESAPGSPGNKPRWTQSAKVGIGTAYNTSSRVWYTISHGIVDEIYFPSVDTPNTRDFQLLITDGETFFHEERADLESSVEYPETNTLLYRLRNRDPEGRYTIEKEIFSDPHQSVVICKVRLDADENIRKKLKVYALTAPRIGGQGAGNNASVIDNGGRALLHAWRDDVHLVMGARPNFTYRSVGFAGESDGWTDLHENYKANWSYGNAEDGNTAMTAQLDFSESDEVVVAVGFGISKTSASAALLQSLAVPTDELRENFVEQWQRPHTDTCDTEKSIQEITRDEGSLFRLSRCILLTHEDKTYQGAMIASLSIPWGASTGDGNSGGYHLVWPRDLLHSGLALLNAGQASTAQRALAYLACVQKPDGDIAQNFWLDGTPYWEGRQLDEVAAPALLAWHLWKRDELQLFDPYPVVARAAHQLMLCGPVTGQERWEENSGYSPSTLASTIAALAAASDFAKEANEDDASELALDYADWMAAHLEKWCVTTKGELVEGIAKHYIRITPADPGENPANPDPDNATIVLKNGGGEHPARNIVGGDFLALCRLGIRPADDPIICDSIKVIDEVLKYDFEGGPCWLRYNHDGYGQKRDGSDFDGSGVGGTWPILTGERGMYELERGNDPTPYFEAMENFANEGGMIPEQLWQFEDNEENLLVRGGPAGSAMPLAWSHAEYINLLHSAATKCPADRIDPAHSRYVEDGHRDFARYFWTKCHALGEIEAGKPLCILLDEKARINWTADPDSAEWAALETEETAYALHSVCLDQDTLADVSTIHFTITTFSEDGEATTSPYSIQITNTN